MTASFDSVAVIGAGLAGASAAVALRERGFSGRIRLIGAESHLPYERPPLSKEFLGGDLPAERLAVHPADAYAEWEIELVLGRPATRLRPAERAVELAGGTRIGADRVLLGTGVRPRSAGVPGEWLSGVHHLRDLEHAQALREVIERGVPLVVVGEGFIGSELASTLAEQGADVTLLMAGDLPMRHALGEEAARWLLGRHRENGVRVLARSPLKSINGFDRVESVEVGDGTVLPAGAVVIGIGSEPVVDLAVGAGLAVDNGVVVDSSSRTSIPEIYAAGDLARFPSRAFNRRLRVEHWQNAQNQAANAVESMLGHDEPYDDIPWAWTEQHGRRWEIAGLPMLGTDVVRRGDPDSAEGALWVFSEQGRVQGAVAVNRRRELRAVRRALAREALVDVDAVRDESVDIRTAIRSADTAVRAAEA
ncbi:NAD(P)/FAD-dependent oxidoreductase [Prauserella flavalba]|uniref:Ferredoxin reductase n=1 Tax=Prauserella flavalba TaxID=1477506 RepID=A0A318LSL1_9PSEU|nr:FAD-dependent oxidoreductase [Prauserella flavalba]PXY25479.1 ferredoxin reductase [Prauserella flavalba]